MMGVFDSLFLKNDFPTFWSPFSRLER